MEIVELPPGDARLAAVYPVMRELRSQLSEQDFERLYEAGHSTVTASRPSSTATSAAPAPGTG